MRIESTNNAVGYGSDQYRTLASQQNVDPQATVNGNVSDNVVRDSAAAADIVHQLYATQKGQQTISEKALSEAIDKANKAIIGAKREFRYSIHEKTNEVMIKVVDTDSGDVVREIPPEKILDLVAKLQELAGVFVDEKR